MQTFFITGGTGYIGSRLVKQLLLQGHRVIVLCRIQSISKVPAGAEIITGNALEASSYYHKIPPKAVFIHLLGVPHPSPAKAESFRTVDLAGAKAAAEAASKAGAAHFIYVSVNMQPGGIMKAYQQARFEAEQYLLVRRLNCTFIRPWYVLGPGHWWPVVLLPLFGLASLVPAWKQKAAGRALVTIGQMLNTLLAAAKATPQPLRIIEIPQIKTCNIETAQNINTLSQAAVQ